MINSSLLDKLDFHLIKVLHTVLTERSVSRAAVRLGMHQPAVSAALRRLREISGDPLMVRSGANMVPTDVGLRMIDPSADILRAAQALFSDVRGFDPAVDSHTFRLISSDYLGPQLIPLIVSRVREKAPLCRIEVQALAGRATGYQQIAQDEADVLLINGFEPTDHLTASPLFDDEVVCLVARDHPAVHEGWTVESWLAAEHIVPVGPNTRGVIDTHLDRLGLVRRCVVTCPYFAVSPEIAAQTQMVVTAGRRYLERFTERLPVVIVPSPVHFPRIFFYQVWHQRADKSSAGQWLRDQIHEVAAPLSVPLP